MNANFVKHLAFEAGFELAGIAPAEPLAEYEYYRVWEASGMAAGMGYLSGDRGRMRRDPRMLVPSARSVLCVAKVYPAALPPEAADTPGRGRISCYARGGDYHAVLRGALLRVVAGIRAALGRSFEWRVCVDTAPLLERALAARAGLGWVARNTCLTNEKRGSSLFLGEVLLSVELEPDRPAPWRCGSCTRCVDACPTGALIPTGRPEGPTHALDARRCISYLTIENRGSIPEELRAPTGNHVFGCDICQQVCPWNRKARMSPPAAAGPPLEELGALDEESFRRLFRGTAVVRARHAGMLRNAAVAMGNSGAPKFIPILERLAAAGDENVAAHALWALRKLAKAPRRSP